jgi:hypothetical protein
VLAAITTQKEIDAYHKAAGKEKWYNNWL